MYNLYRTFSKLFEQIKIQQYKKEKELMTMIENRSMGSGSFFSTKVNE